VVSDVDVAADGAADRSSRTVDADVSVCHVLGSLGAGGRESLIENVIGYTAGSVSHSVACFQSTETGRGRFEERDVPVVTFDADSTRDVGALVEFARHLVGSDVDVVHAHGMNAQIPTRLVAPICGFAGVVSTHHGVQDLYPDHLTWLERLTRRLDARTVAVSDGVRRSFVGGTTAGSSQWRTVRNGIDVDGFAAGIEAADGESIRRAHEITPADTVFLNVGRYVPPKSQLDLIEAMDSLSVQRRDVHLFVVGGRGPMDTILRERVAEYDLEEYVTIPGRVDDIHSYYAAADVFVSSSVGEGLPIVQLEAMAGQLPVIATDIPGVREVVLDGKTGTLVPPNAPDSLATAMQDCCDPERRRRYGEAGRTRVADAFDVRETGRAYVSLYESIVDGRGTE
jgi:glycosyltransferase involved in cell wall biosynthesis